MAKKSGLPTKYIKQWGISKKAWAEYRKDQKGTSKRKKSGPSTARKVVKKVAKKKFYVGFILGLLGLIFASSKDRSSIFVSWKSAIQGKYKFEDAVADTLANTIGYDPRWGGSWRVPMGTVSLMGGVVLHKIGVWSGVNRMLGRMISPLNKIAL